MATIRAHGFRRSLRAAGTTVQMNLPDLQKSAIPAW